MYLKDFHTALHIRTAYCYLTVKTARTQNSRIQDIDTVGRSHDDDTLIHTKAIHLNEKLV